MYPNITETEKRSVSTLLLKSMARGDRTSRRLMNLCPSAALQKLRAASTGEKKQYHNKSLIGGKGLGHKHA